MEVYRASAFGKPPGASFDYYAHLKCKKSCESFLSQRNFAGCPFPKKWRRVELFFDEPLRPRADFYHLGPGILVCNERARELTGCILESVGEFLPVTIEGEEGVHYIYNVTNSGPFMDPAKSVREYLDPSKSVLPLVAPAFRSDVVKNQYIFKIPEDSGRTIYSVEHEKGGKKLGLKVLVEHHDLTGLRFEFAWSEKHGPIPWQTPPALPGMGWITGDGKEFRPKRVKRG